MSSPSALDRPIALAELVDTAALDEVIRGFAEFHGIGLAVTDTSGQLVAHAGAPVELCEAMRDRPPGRARCEAKLRELHELRLFGDAPATRCECFTGLRYQVSPLVFEGTLLGNVAFGPYQPEERAIANAGLTGIVQGILGPGGLGEGEAVLAKLRPLSDAQARKILEHICRMLGVLLHSAYARHLTAQLHVATLADTYEELADKNRRLAEAVERMQEVDRLKSGFLATVSHELRTPLTSVIGYSEMLLEGLAGALNSEQKEYVQIIMEKGDQLLQLISGILDVSRMETGAMRLTKEPVDLDELVASAIMVMAPLARRKRLEVRGSTAFGAPRALGDREKLRQVVVNLLGNAIKFTADGGRIEIHIEVGAVSRDEELAMFGALTESTVTTALGSSAPPAAPLRLGVRLRVVDSGIGIAPEKQARIFEPFFQVDSSSTREYGGTGLGLTLVKSYVEAHGGQVWVESELGRGSVFTVTLPAVNEELARFLRSAGRGVAAAAAAATREGAEAGANR